MKLYRMIHVIVAVGCFAFGLPSNAETYKMFWLTETISGTTIGPVVKRPGNRFRAAGKEWTILSSKPGQILFADAAASTQHGPYDFTLQRIIELGDVALSFSRIEKFTGTNPTLDYSRTTPRTISKPEASVAKPVRRDLRPLPSTNPADHLSQPTSPAMVKRRYPPTAVVWMEPIRNVKYDWSVGDFAGNSGEDMEMKRYGVEGSWRNLFLEVSAISDAKTGGTVVPDETYLSDLGLTEGSGYALRGGYVYSFVIDGNWNANLGGYGSYEETSFDMNATVFTRHGEVVASSTVSAADAADGSSADNKDSTAVRYSFDRFTEEVSMEEMSLTMAGGIDYASDFFGLGAFVTIDFYSDTSFSGSIAVLDENYKLAADKTHPVGIALAGWYSPFMDYIVTASASIGTETAVRIGFGKTF